MLAEALFIGIVGISVVIWDSNEGGYFPLVSRIGLAVTIILLDLELFEYPLAWGIMFVQF